MTTTPQPGELPDEMSDDRPVAPETIVQRPPSTRGAPPTEERRAPGTPGAPPTISQRPPGTSGTPGAPPTISQRAAQGPDADASAPRSAPFPSGLLAEYEPVEEIGHGFESIVWHAVRRADGESVAVKVYWIGKSIDHRVLTVLRRPEFRRYAPRIDEVGVEKSGYGVHEWIVMEYLPTSLAHVVRDERTEPGGLPHDRARALLGEIAELLDFWYEQDGLIPTDVKPDNFALRPGIAGGPDELVLCDFGGTARDTATAAIAANGEIMAARAYLAPEALGGVFHPASPFWSLGHIVYEMVTGTPYFRVDERDQTILLNVATAEPDVSGVPDDTWRLLVAGLFTRAPEDRWRAPEIRRWLAGERPDVIRPAVPDKRAPTPMQFHTTTHRSPDTLARALLEDSKQAAPWMQSEGGRLADWLDEYDLAGDFDVGLLRRDRTSIGPELVLQFGAVHAPDARPACFGHPVDVRGLTRLCGDADAGHRVLPLLFGGEGATLLEHAARFRCGHGRCCPHPGAAEGEPGCGCRCLRLLDVADAVPGIVAEAKKIITEARWAGNPFTGPSAQSATRTLYGTALGLTLGNLATREALGTALYLPAAVIGRRAVPGPRGWAELCARAARTGRFVAGGRAAVTAVAVLRPGMELKAGPSSAERLREAASYRLRAALVLVPALALAAWSGAVSVRLLTGRVNPWPTEMTTGMSETIGTDALQRVTTLLPLVLFAALLACALPRRAASTVLTLTGVTFLLGWFPGALPGLDEREWAPGALAHALGNWTGIAGFLLVPIAALVLAGTAASILANVKARLGDGPNPVRLKLRAWGVPVLLVSVSALLWSTMVLGDVFGFGFTYSEVEDDGLVHVPSTGRDAAQAAVDLAPGLLAVAITVGLMVRGRRDATRPILIAVAIAVVLGLWTLWVPADVRDFVPVLDNPALTAFAREIGDLGGATWWWAIVLPLAVHAVLASIRKEK